MRRDHLYDAEGSLFRCGGIIIPLRRDHFSDAEGSFFRCGGATVEDNDVVQGVRRFPSEAAPLPRRAPLFETRRRRRGRGMPAAAGSVASRVAYLSSRTRRGRGMPVAAVRGATGAGRGCGRRARRCRRLRRSRRPLAPCCRSGRGARPVPAPVARATMRRCADAATRPLGSRWTGASSKRDVTRKGRDPEGT